mgnify:CR=1 FL=1
MVKNKGNHNSSEVGTLLEHIDGKVSLIAEQYTGLNDKYSRLDKKVDSLPKRVDNVVDMVGAIKENVEVLKDDVSIIKMDIETIKHDLKSKIGRDEFSVLERRVALLESRR